MAKFRNYFTSGKMNKDIDSRLVPSGEYRDALNFSPTTSATDSTGAVENSLSNKALATVNLGTGPFDTLGMFVDNTRDRLYWFVKSTTGNYVVEYDTIGDTTSLVLQDTRAGAANVLNFDTNFLITGVASIYDSDNDVTFLAWTDNKNPVRFINIDRAKTYAINGFDEEDVALIKAPPLFAPTITLTNSTATIENNISERFLRFGYRYKYLDGEYSALSPFSETAFRPKSFAYDYSTSTNESMVNQFNQVDIGYNTGPDIVTDIELVLKESNSSTVYVIDSINKAENSFADNVVQTFNFVNNQIYRALAADQLGRLFDAVPNKAQALEVIGSRLILGNYTEGYDIARSGTPVKIDYAVNVVNTAITVGTGTETMKSNRDYEVGIVYMDDFGRQTTVLTSATPTAFVGNDDCVNQNELRVTIANLAPDWATKYRFFLKQSRDDYDVIVPAVFYQDGVYSWVRLEADDANKINVGDSIYVKSDASQVLAEAVKTRVLEIATKEVNFLENTPPDPFSVLQQAGTYMRIKPTDFNLNPASVAVYENVLVGFRTDNTSNNYQNNIAYLEPAVYYGTGGLNDLTESGTYTGTDDIRYEVDIFTVGPTDTYRFRKTTTSDGVVGAWDDNGTLGYSITGSAQTLDNGVQITFGATTGHALDDNWIISAKSTTRVTATNEGGTVGSLGRRALMHYKAKATTDTNGEGILAGAVITITYDDSRSNAANVDNIFGRSVDTFISSGGYANIEEWFFKENIISQLTPTLVIGDVLFRRGTFVKTDGQQISINTTGDMFMTFSSLASYTGSSSNEVRTDQILEIRELNNNIIFETVPDNDDSDIFFEIGQTYDIAAGTGYHLGNGGTDVNQTAVLDAVITLPVFNAFAWGNGFESYKVKDLFTGKVMKIDSRPSGTITDYRENTRIADLTYSKVYEQSTNFNGINEFNLTTANFKQMDDKYQSIQKLYSENTDLIVYQEDKIHQVPYAKDILFDAAGTGFIQESSNVLGTARPVSGEYGISTVPESFAVYGNRKYNLDPRRGAVLRLSLDGITEISQYGMDDYFSDFFRDNPNNKMLGAFDLHEKLYTINLGPTENSLTFSEDAKGFPSFYSYRPDWMGSINNKFYSIKDGQIYEHYDEVNPVRNNFYGVQYDSSIKLVINEAPSEIKVVKAIETESNKPFDLTIKSYLNDETVSITQSTIADTEFLNKEGKWHGYVRRNELTTDKTAKSIYGLGEVTSVATSVITMSNPISKRIRVGDDMYDAADVLIGNITAYDTVNNTITVDTTPSITPGTFTYGSKPARIEGSEIRGYNFEVDLVDSTTTRTELFGLGSEIFKSFPS